jgi:multimeric flavodoxin WrbA
MVLKALAVVVSARKQGNCFDIASYILDQLKEKGAITELVNFWDYQITPCQHCEYECLQKQLCPIEDDVEAIWRKVWETELLFLIIPNYGGMPPALWLAFSQRSQSLKEPPQDKSFVSAIVLASPHLSSGAQWTPSVISDEIKWLGKKVACFEVINNNGYELGNSYGGLIKEIEVKRRLDFIIDRSLKLATQ